MPNQYKYNATYADLHDEEDREVINDLYRDQSEYYKTLTEINKIYLKALSDMSINEVKDVLKFRTPIERLK